MVDKANESSQQKVKFKTIYIPDGFEPMWEAFVKYMKKKGGASTQIREWITAFMKSKITATDETDE